MSARTVLRNSFWRIPPAGVFLSLIVICLTFLGLVVLFSVSQQHANPTSLLQKQVIWLVIATFAGGFVMMVDL
ncbi:MAG: cell division protein FtsW, partial [Coraliomargarita sp.]